jgi:FAD/FMN-containing dehydrogenase
VRWDTLSRQLYATDASIYQVQPLGVALPNTAEETAGLMAVLNAEGISMIPRGAGTGLAGGALGRGMVLDMARYNRSITEFNADALTVRVGAGVVLDQLNAYLAPGQGVLPEIHVTELNWSDDESTPYTTTVNNAVNLAIIIENYRHERMKVLSALPPA